MTLLKWQHKRLTTVQRRLEALATPGKNSCAVADEHKQAVHSYIQTWILPHIEVLTGSIERNSLQDIGDDA